MSLYSSFFTEFKFLSAQKMHVKLDSVVIRSEESTFLQQAAHLTHGFYRRIDSTATLLQQLLTFYLNPVSRQMFVSPSNTSVDSRAACVCHQKLVEFAYMCSVCLALHCSDDLSECLNCGAKCKRRRQNVDG